MQFEELMSQRRNDTTDGDAPAQMPRAPGSYYDDDATGYEPYDPAQDEDEAGDEEAGTKQLTTEDAEEHRGKT